MVGKAPLLICTNKSRRLQNAGAGYGGNLFGGLRVTCGVDATATGSGTLADPLEAFLQDCLAELPLPELGKRPGRPPLLSVFVLWAGLLVCVLRGFTAQRSLWQLLCARGLWRFPAVTLSEQALYQRLARLGPEPFLQFFVQLTAVLRTRYAAVDHLRLAPFATEVFALDHSLLDPVCRKLQLFRQVPAGASCLLPGRLASLFDLRRQLWWRVEFWEEARRHETCDVEDWLQHVPVGSLFVFDLGFYAFRWFDALTQGGCYFVSRLRVNSSFQVLHTLYDGPAGPVHLRDQWVYLGAYRADRASQPLRLLEIRHATTTYRYLTNVLDPALLPAADVQGLYRRRWDIEQAFNTLKTHLNLFLVWSGQPGVVQLQVAATLVLAQVVQAFRLEVAREAEADVREVSLPLLLRWLPELAATGVDPVAVIAQRGRLGGLIRPFRGKEYAVPVVAGSAYTLPAEHPPPRTARYAQKQPSGQPAPSTRRGGWKRRTRRPKSA